MLITHIAIALLSLAYTAYVYFAPTNAKLQTTYVLTALTIGTGTWLVVANPAHMLQSCMMGLVYLGTMFFGIALSRNKLAAEITRQHGDRE